MSTNEHEGGTRSRRVSLSQRLRQSGNANANGNGNGNRPAADDLFLNLALDEPDTANTNTNTTTTPATATATTPTLTSSAAPGNSNGRYKTTATTTTTTSGVTPLRKAITVRERARSNQSSNLSPTLSQAADLRDATHSPTLTHASNSTTRTTPSYRAAGVRKPRYNVGTTSSSSFEAAARDWNASPDLLKFPSRRQSVAPSEAASRQPRLYRVGAYESLNGSRHSSRGHVTPTLSPSLSVRKKSDPDTDSGDSANAPSTVWDELDDLKSRIKNLEISGKVPSSSGPTPTTQSSERPRTATTAPTTISSSPKYTRKQSAAPTEATTAASTAVPTTNPHPLLHNALKRAKAMLDPQLYRSLETAANDAIGLAAMTGSGASQGAASVVNGGAVSERHVRRKADIMCRNLTDLCIALCDGKADLPSPNNKSPLNISRLATPPSRYGRRTSMGPEDTHLKISPGRSFSRLESRRSSLLGLRLGSALESSPLEDNSSPDHDQIDYAARYISRPGTSMLRARYSQHDDHDGTEDNLPSRAPSRAMTDLGHSRQRSTRRSDYGVGLQHSPSLRETLAARRADAGIPEEDGRDGYYASPSLAQEVTRRIIERRVALQHEESTIVPKRRRLASLTHAYAESPRLNAESPRLGSTPIRTSSLSRRRNIVVD